MSGPLKASIKFHATFGQPENAIGMAGGSIGVTVQVLAFPKSWRSISLNTDRYLHTACFVL